MFDRVEHPIEPQPAAVLNTFNDGLNHWLSASSVPGLPPPGVKQSPVKLYGAMQNRIVGLLRELCEGAGLRRAPEVLGSWMIAELVAHGTKQRNAGVLAEAEQSVAFLMEIAHELVREFPKEAGSYVVLSDAFVQEYKNAWKRSSPRGH